MLAGVEITNDEQDHLKLTEDGPAGHHVQLIFCGINLEGPS